MQGNLSEVRLGELRLSGNHSVTEYEMSGKPCSQKSGLKNHTNERIFQVMKIYTNERIFQVITSL